MSGIAYIEHEGRLLQTHISNDGNTYKIGDEVPSRISFHFPGSWANGTYEAEPNDGNTRDRYLAVVKDYRLAEIWAVPWGDEGPSYETVNALIREQHGDFDKPPRELWPELAWEAEQWRRDRAEAGRIARKQARTRKRLEKARAHAERTPDEIDAGLKLLLVEAGCPEQYIEDYKKNSSGVASAALAFLDKLETERMEDAADAMNEFTRSKMREPGFFRMLMGPWKDREDLAVLVRDQVIEELHRLVGWHYGEDMLLSAISYRTERLLVEQGKWEDDVSWPVLVRPQIVDGQIRVEVQQLTNRAC